MFLLDTMVLSELNRSQRHAGVVAWVGAQRCVMSRRSRPQLVDSQRVDYVLLGV